VNDTSKDDHDLLIRVETKVDAFINAQSDHELRLRVLEASREKLEGNFQGVKVIVAFLSLMATLATAFGAWIAFFK
jgi:nitrogen fixation/metabolism regulation signal transduction histidine kinase